MGLISIEEQYNLREIISSYSMDYDKYKINFSLVETPPNPYIEIQNTTSELVSCTVEVSNKEDGEQIILPVALMEVPLRTSMGLKIDGTNYEICSLNERANGWYHVEAKNSSGELLPVLELIPEHGRNLKFLSKNGILYVKIGSGKSSLVNLGVFLKAMTRLSYRQLLKLLGVRNRFIASTLVNELSFEESVDAVLKVLLPNSAKSEGYLAIPRELRDRELHNILGPKYLRLNKLSRDRYNRDTSFKRRALDLELAKPVLSYGIGKKLTAEILDEIDNSDVDTLYVFKNKTMYELKKYKVEGIDLHTNEILTEINMLCNNLAGFELFDDKFNETNRTVLSLEDSVRIEISNILMSITDYIRSYLLEKSISLKNLSLDRAVPADTRAFINKCKLEFKHSQGAETTNVVSYIAKESKVVLDYSGKTNDKMISIKASQQSMYDHFHIPESDKVGLVSHMTMATTVGSDGMVYAPYLVVKDGRPESMVPILLNPRQREGKYIAPWDEDLTKGLVRCYYGDRVITVPSDQIDYQEFTVLQTLSLPTAMIAYLQFSEGKRITMGCNQNKQALPCLKSEAPLVSTGALCLDKNTRNAVLRAQDILSDMYFSNDLHSVCEHDEFIKGTIHLDTVDTSTIGYRGYLFTCKYGNRVFEHSVILPFCKKATDNTMFHYYLNYQPNHDYSGRDIVLYNNSVDINKYDNDYHINLGAQKVDNSIFDFDSALGANYLIAYKSFGIPNMDDGIIISDELLGTGKLAHVKVVEIKEQLKNFKEGVREKFEIKAETFTHNKDGLPKKGIWLKPRSNVFGITVTEKGIDTERYTTLGADVEGEVIFTAKEGDTAIAYIATISDIELGDKLSGDHGNKGVVGKIVPKKDMPFMEDGTPIQITANPLGIPSRMNLSQLFVALLSFAAKVDGKRFIISPANPDSYDIAQEYFKEHEIGPKQLYDGRTGRPFDRTTTVGYLYYKKLSHTVTSKMNNCGLPTSFNPTTGQPNKGKSVSGGQTMGEMETWTFEANGAYNFLQELFSVKSDDVYGRKQLRRHLEDGTVFEGKAVNNNMDMLQTELRLLGSELELVDDNYKVRPLLDKDIKGLQLSPLKNTRDALQDDNIFGSAKGPEGINYAKKCWGYIDLNCEIIHPIWIYKSIIPSIIMVIERKEVQNHGGKELEEDIISLGRDKIRDLIDGKYFIEIFGKDVYGTRDSSLLENPKCGITALVDIFKILDFKECAEILDMKIESIKKKSKKINEEMLFGLINKKESLENLINQGINAKDLILTTFPVIPKNFRYKMDGRNSNFDIYYSRILSACQVSNTLDPTKVYNRVLELIGLDGSKKLASDAQTKNALEYFTGKGTDNKSHGAIRNSALSKVVCFSGRSVIVPGELRLGYVGLPRQACYNLLRIQLPYEFAKHIDIFSADDNLDLNPLISGLELADVPRCINFLEKNFFLSEEDALVVINKCDDIVRDLLSKTAVALGRQPTLHNKSIRGLIPQMVEGNAVRLHPLLCSEFNADFDGDQMWYAMAHEPASIRELLTNCNPVTGLYSDKDGSVSLLPSQDILLGLYLATMLHENVLDVTESEKYNIDNLRYYNALHSLQYDLESGFINYKDLVCLKHNGNKYISTAGRLILNSIIPNGFTNEVYDNSLNIPYINPNNYKKLRYDGLVRKSKGTIVFTRGNESLKYNCISISSLIQASAKDIAPEECLEFLDNLVEFGIECCIRSGITLHLDDFLEDDVKYKYVAVYNKFIDECNTLYELGLITEEDRKDNAIKASAYAIKTIKSDLLSHYPRNNNLFIIIDSGARGNESQVMRSSGLIGTINKTNTEQMETPIMTSFKHGLKSSDVFIMANGTRNGITTVQKDTGKVGEMTRALVFSLAGLKITENDCGCGYKDLKVLYADSKTDTVDLINKKLNPNSQLYKDTINITKDGLINADVIKFIFKHKITDVELNDSSVFKIEYKLSTLFRSMMLNKLAIDLPGLDRNSIVTEATLDYIEQQQFKIIKARTVITCESKEGICARCYGILHNTKTLPPIGYACGIIAGQSIGEPATQLNLDTINAAGSGNATANTVNLFKSMASGSIPKAFKKSIVAPNDTYIDLQDSGDSCIISLFDKKYKVPKSDLEVINGEKVNAGQEITRGVLDVKDIPTFIPNFVDVRMFKQLETYYGVFSGSNVFIDARHFEVLVKAQLSFVFILDSDNPDLPEGSIQPYCKVAQAIDSGCSIQYFNRPLKKTEQIIQVSGPLAAICHHDPAQAVARISINKNLQNDKTSLISNLITGTDLVDGNKAKPNAPKYKDYVDEVEHTQVEETNNIVDTNIFQVQEMTPSIEVPNVDLSDLFSDGFDLFGDDEEEDDVAIDLDRDTSAEVPSETTNTSTNNVVNETILNSNIFGGGVSSQTLNPTSIFEDEDSIEDTSKTLESISEDIDDIDIDLDDDEDEFVEEQESELFSDDIDIDIDLD